MSKQQIIQELFNRPIEQKIWVAPMVNNPYQYQQQIDSAGSKWGIE